MKKHHTKTKGDLGVLKIKCDLCEKGYMLLTPDTEHSPFDVVAYKDNIFIRIQVKYRALVNGCLIVPFRTSWADKNGSHAKRYKNDDFDVFAMYCKDNDKCYYIWIKDFPNYKSNLSLRINEAKVLNKNIIFAKDYEKLICPHSSVE